MSSETGKFEISEEQLDEEGRKNDAVPCELPVMKQLREGRPL